MSPFTESTHGASDPLPPGCIEQGAGEPLILLHPGACSPVIWRDCLPLLAAEHRVIALAALGHRGGRRCEQRPCPIPHLVDDAERSLDALSIDRAHLAGNSLGGWLALELARRGRARSVCAFSPAGMWDSVRDHGLRAKLRKTFALVRVAGPVLPFCAKYPALLKLLLRDTAEHGDRVPGTLLLEIVDAMLDCEIIADFIDCTDTFSPLETDCPVDVVWSDRDRMLPVTPFADTARKRVPGARHLILTDAGHAPMLDDPQRVARTILDTVARAAAARERIAPNV